MSRLVRSGFTLLEILIAMFIAIILTAGTYSLFVAQSRAMKNAKSVSEIQDNSRVAMDVLIRDIRSAGYLLTFDPTKPPVAAVRIENNCGGSATGGTASPDLSANGNGGLQQVARGNGTAVKNGGVVNITAYATACPNGSDRLTVVTRPKPQNVQSDCTDYNCSGGSMHVQLPCTSYGNNCQTALDQAGIAAQCGSSNCPTSSQMVCVGSDPNTCVSVYAQPSGAGGGGNSCLCSSTNCDVKFWSCNSCSGCPMTVGNTPGPIIANKGNLAFNAFTFRSYQLLDVGAAMSGVPDGYTSLVYNDHLQDAELGNASAGTGGNWTVVASYIDDFQVSYAKAQTPTTFTSGMSLLNLPAAAGYCTPSASVDCLDSLFTANNQPVALRVTIIARGQKKEMQGSSEVAAKDLYRGQLEDNNPSPTVFNPAAPCWTCTSNGNDQGFPRRVVTEVVSLRNLGGAQF